MEPVQRKITTGPRRDLLGADASAETETTRRVLEKLFVGRNDLDREARQLVGRAARGRAAGVLSDRWDVQLDLPVIFLNLNLLKNGNSFIH